MLNDFYRHRSDLYRSKVIFSACCFGMQCDVDRMPTSGISGADHIASRGLAGKYLSGLIRRWVDAPFRSRPDVTHPGSVEHGCIAPTPAPLCRHGQYLQEDRGKMAAAA